jgi:hypothetical protein
MNIPQNIMPWACLPASLSMVLNIPFTQAIKELGHSGDALPYADGVTRKGFHIQECIDIALLHGFSVVEILAYFGSRPNASSVEQVPTLSLDAAIRRFKYYLSKCKLGILGGMVQLPDRSIINHAAAWDGEKIYDPRGISYTYEDAPRKNFLPQTLWMFLRLETNDETTFLAT